jgi:hypothetical protein
MKYDEDAGLHNRGGLAVDVDHGRSCLQHVDYCKYSNYEIVTERGYNIPPAYQLDRLCTV